MEETATVAQQTIEALQAQLGKKTNSNANVQKENARAAALQAEVESLHDQLNNIQSKGLTEEKKMS